MVLAIALGLVCGIIGFLPLTLGLKLAKKATPTSNFGHASSLLLGVLLSFLLLAGGVFVCIFVARDLALPFVLAEAAGLVLFALGYGIYKRLHK